MTDDDKITRLQELLAIHRRTLAVLLRQLANLGAGYAPPGVHNGIAEARAQIARLTAALRDAGVAIDEQMGDVAAPDEMAGPAGAPVLAAPHAARDVNIATNQTIVNVSHHHPQPCPVIDPDEAQQQIDRLPLDAIPDPALLPPGSRMPLRRNPLFVGREADLKALAAALKGGSVAAITTGIGGVGKTQLATEFAHRYGQFFVGGVFWLSFADPAGIDSEIATCGGAGAMELYSDASGFTQAEQVAKVYAAWERDIPRLLIFDNCDDTTASTAEALLAARLPRGGCRVLVTSRSGQWHTGMSIAALPLGILGRAESIALLRSHRDELDDADADAIAAELGDLPLALSLAGSYLETYRDEAFGAPATYLANLHRQLLDHRSLQGAGAAPSLTGHELNVRATFALSYQRLDAADPVDALAIAALARAAHLAPGEPFPHDLLLATLGDATEDEEIGVQRADAIGRLIALGLLEKAEGDTLRVHRLIAAFARVAIDDDAAQATVEEALIRRAYQITDAGYPAPMDPILAHLRHATEVAAGRADQRAASLAGNLGAYLLMIADCASARPLFERSLQISEQVWGEQHLDTVTSLNNLAGLLQAQGDVETAQRHHERALAIREQALGPNHPDTAQSLWWLGTLLRQAGDRDGARERLQRAVAVYIHTLGEQHPTTQQCQRQLVALDAPPPSAAQQIAEITAHFEDAVAAALADPTIDRAALAEQLEAVAQQAEEGGVEGSPLLAFTIHLRALTARLAEPSDASVDIDR